MPTIAKLPISAVRMKLLKDSPLNRHSPKKSYPTPIRRYNQGLLKAEVQQPEEEIYIVCPAYIMHTCK